MRNFIIIITCFMSLVVILSCNKDDEKVVSNDLKKRVILIESFDADIATYVSDSTIEYYENKMIVRQDSYIKLDNEAPYIGFFKTFAYNAENNLIEIKSYNDINLSENYASTIYHYNDSSIEEVVYNKFTASNFSDRLANKTTHYEYLSDTIKTHAIDHLDNDSREDLRTRIVYGDLDSIDFDSKWRSVFDNENDLYEVNCIGDDCSTYYNREYQYGNSREPIISNVFGSDLNSFILGSSIKYYNLENAKKYTDRVLSIYPSADRNGNVRAFNYIFDEDDRLKEVFTTGSFAANDVIRYYYE